jgi:hypothetical protein
MAVPVTNAVRVAPITDADVRRVAEFLHANLNTSVPAEHWARAVDVPWTVDRPNAGFMLLDDDTVVGVQLAFYSERAVNGRRERFCNLGAWCVLPAYRLHSLLLVRAALAQEGYHFTDLSPSGNVVGVNTRLGFRFLDASTALVPNLPWPTWRERYAISSDPELIERTLTGPDLELYRDHAATGAARHLVVLGDDEWCYVVFRKERWKRLPLFVTLLHVSDPEVFRRAARPLARHLLIHHGAVASLVEDRILGYRPRPSVRVRPPRPRMFRSPDLEPAQVDYLYSELVCVSW